MDIAPEDIHEQEARPDSKGWYFVELFQYKKEDAKDPDLINDYVFYDGEKWDMGEYAGTCVVNTIFRKYEDPEASKPHDDAVNAQGLSL